MLLFFNLRFKKGALKWQQNVSIVALHLMDPVARIVHTKNTNTMVMKKNVFFVDPLLMVQAVPTVLPKSTCMGLGQINVGIVVLLLPDRGVLIVPMVSTKSKKTLSFFKQTPNKIGVLGLKVVLRY